MSKILITSALPYINGVKHLGNLVGSLLPADVHARFRRQVGDEVLFICGTDEHGTPAELGAIEAGAERAALLRCAACHPGRHLSALRPVVSIISAARPAGRTTH
jgi:methionyl-tRNA synthetase